jgi:two-component system LytT family response regulator
MPDLLKAVVIDDEALSREKIIRYLSEARDVALAGEAATADEGEQLVLRHRPDVVFVDIRLPDRDGLSMAGTLRQQLGPDAPRFIVSTAYDQHALRAFEIHAIDYLVKPYSRERFHASLTHLRAGWMQAHTSISSQIVIPPTAPIARPRRVTLHCKGRLLVFDTREIACVVAEDNYVIVHAAGQKHLLRLTLSEVERALPADSFVRTHRGALANIRAIREIRAFLI